MTGNTITPDLLLISSNPEGSWRPQVPRGSFYVAVEDYLDSIRSQKRFQADWFVDYDTGKRLKVAEIKGLSRRYGALFYKHGVRPHDILHMLVGPLDICAFFIAFGTWINGGVISAGNPNYDSIALSHQLQEAGSKFVATTVSTLPLVKEAIGLLKPEERPIVFCIGRTDDKDVVDLLQELEKITERDCPEPVHMDVFKDIAAIMYTSGTTGHPKGVIHTHYSACNYFANTFDSLELDSSFLFNASTYMQSIIFASVAYLVKGITLILNFPNSELFLPRLLSAMKEHNPSGVVLGAEQFQKFADSDLLYDLNPEVTGSVRNFSPAAALMPAHVEERIRRIFPNVDSFLNVYGTSETGLFTSGTTHVGGKMGRIVQGVEIKVVDPKSGKRLGPNRHGEIRVKSPFMMQGYFKRPEATKEYFDEEGFARIGDLAYYDEMGDIYYVDRLLEMIHPDKDNAVSPRELEEVLQEHEAVRECLIWGKTIETGDDLISACVVLKEGFTENQAMEDVLREFTDSRLVEARRIRGGITFHPSLPRSPHGKLMRSQMKKRMLEAKAAAQNA